MTKDVITVDESASAMEAARLMAEKRIGSLVVANDGNSVGIVTESDFIKKVVAKGLDASDLVVQDVMSRPLLTASVETGVRDVVVMMREKGIRRLPLTQNGRVVGIVTVSDLTWLFESIGRLRGIL